MESPSASGTPSTSGSREHKETVLAELGYLVKSGDISWTELQSVYRAYAPAAVQVPLSSQEKAAKARHVGGVLYFVGTLIVCLSIVVFVSSNWQQLPAAGRIGATLGLGIVLLLVALRQSRRVPDVNADFLANSLFTMSSVGIAVGAVVVVDELFSNWQNASVAVSLAAVLTMLFAVLYRQVCRSLVLAVASIISAVAVYISAVEWALTGYQGRTNIIYPLVIALAGVLLGVGGRVLRRRALLSRLTDGLYEMGSLVALGALYWLTFVPAVNGSSLLFDILYPAILVAAVGVSVRLNSRTILGVAAFFLTAYIFEITAEYFWHVLGGSVSLAISGVLVLAIAFGATRFAKRYLR